MRSRNFVAGAVATLAVCGAAQAQLIVGFDDTAAGVTTCWEIRVADGSYTATPLFSGIDVWGLAADDANRTLYINSGTELWKWSYDGGAPTLVANFTFGGASQSVVGLSFGNGKLYAVKNVSNEAMYEVNVVDGTMSIVNDYTDADYDLGGLDYDNLTGKHYATNDDTTPNGSGLFSIEPGGAITKIIPYPTGRTDIDGLAMGDGRAYFVEDEPQPIRVYNLTTGMFEADIPNPMTTSEIFSAGAWAPGMVSAPPCPADLNGDGLVDFADYLEFLNLYDAQDPRADFNQDGLVDFADYLEFLNHYDAGC